MIRSDKNRYVIIIIIIIMIMIIIIIIIIIMIITIMTMMVIAMMMSCKTSDFIFLKECVEFDDINSFSFLQWHQ